MIFSEHADCIRPIDYRWLRSKERFSQPELVLRSDDKWIRATFEYFCRQAGRELPEVEGQISDWRPPIEEAVALNDDPNPLRRWAVEARVIANEPVAEIAGKCGLASNVVETYEQLFFDVRNRLGTWAWTLGALFEETMSRAITPADLRLLWRLVGYNFGAEALDRIIDPNLFERRFQLPEHFDALVLELGRRLLFGSPFTHAFSRFMVSPFERFQLLLVRSLNATSKFGQAGASPIDLRSATIGELIEILESNLPVSEYDRTAAIADDERAAQEALRSQLELLAG